MSWHNVRLIFAREVRDQLRDRRTMFMIVVLPIMLYPLLGLSAFQVSQFMTQHPTRVLVIGARDLPAEPPLIDMRQFDGRWFNDPANARLLELHFATHDEARATEPQAPPTHQDTLTDAQASELVKEGAFHLVIVFPQDFAERLENYCNNLRERAGSGQVEIPPRGVPGVPRPIIYHNSAREQSQIAYMRASEVLERWITDIGRSNLVASGVDPSAASPVAVDKRDVADKGHRDAAVWSKVLPFIVLLWALTGAFYPAVDLCAGEKERGTLETLLCSPAARTEIVWGKLLTIMLFSMMTVVLNVLSVGLSGFFVLREMSGISWPPLLTPLWLFLVMVPASALFSALCLALAAFARSTKEGQYYLMPVLLITMPLVVLPLSPAVELNLGNSLIPITGLVLLLQELLEGNYAFALPYVATVTVVTLVCCLAAIRWAVDQFNSETVLFRESERLDLGLWLKQMFRHREDTPSVGMAVFCGITILLVHFFLSVGLKPPTTMTWKALVVMALVTQLVVILTPSLLMTVMLTRSPRATLRLHWPSWRCLAAALGLVVCLYPAINALRVVVLKLYPMDDSLVKALEAALANPPSLWQALLVVAIVPAICEELAFRGFILSGLRRTGSKWQAIAVTSFFFAITHSIMQQSMLAFVMGLVLGYIAVQTASILPCILFHATQNSLALLTGQLTPQYVADHPWTGWLVGHLPDDTMVFHWPIVVAGVVVAGTLLVWLSGQGRPRPFEEAEEETLCETLPSGQAGSLVG